MENKRQTGRVTIPTDVDVVPETLQVIRRLGADAVRDCDGTDFPAALREVDAKGLDLLDRLKDNTYYDDDRCSSK